MAEFTPSALAAGKDASEVSQDDPQPGLPKLVRPNQHISLSGEGAEVAPAADWEPPAPEPVTPEKIQVRMELVLLHCSGRTLCCLSLSNASPIT